MRFLKTNTAVIVTVGPFYDKTDGVTIETALTITNERITLTADTDDGSAPTNILDNVTGATSGTDNDLNYITGNDAGMMQLELSAANTNRLGRLLLSITDAANHVPVFHEFMVLPAMIYDAFILGTDVLQADVTQWLGTAAATPSVAGVPEVDLTHVAGATTNVAALATNVDAILTDTSTTLDDLIDTEVASIITLLGTPAGASISADIAAIEAQTDDIGAAGAGLTALASQASVDTIDNLLDTEIPALTSAIQGLMLVSGTIGATGNSTTALHLDGLAYADDGINSLLLTIKDVSTGLFYSRWIEDWANTGDLATVATLPFTPEASVDLYWILPIRADVTGGSGLDAAGVRAAVGLASANLDTQLSTIDDLVDTEVASIVTLLGTPAGASISADIAAIEAQTDDIGAAGAGLTALATQASVNTIDDFLDTEIAAILADTNELQTDWVNGGRLDLLIDAIKVVTDLINTAQAEPTGAPAVNETPLEKLAYLFMVLRNKITVTASAKTFFDDGGAAEWSKALSDDGTTYAEAEGA